MHHGRTKHVEIDRNFIKEKLEARIICLPFVRSKDHIADILTNAVANKPFTEVLSKLSSKLSIGDPTTQLEERVWEILGAYLEILEMTVIRETNK